MLVFQGFTGPAATNTPGRAFFASKGIAVSDTGQIAANAPSMAALNALRAVQTFEDRKRGTVEAMAYSASVGVTTNADMGAFNLPGTPDLQGSFEADTLASANQFRMYDAVLALAREGRMTTRLRIFFLTMDTRPDVPVLSQRLRNTFGDFGDGMVKVSGIGEFATQWPLFGQAPPTNYTAALQAVARAGWAFQQHSLSPAENELTISTFETVNKTTPIKDLRWSLAHVGVDRRRRDQPPEGDGRRHRGAPVPVPRRGPRRSAAAHDRRQRHQGGRRVRLGADLHAQPVEHDFLHGHRPQLRRHADQRRPAADAQEALRLYTAENGWFLREEAPDSGRSSRASSRISRCSATTISIRSGCRTT